MGHLKDLQLGDDEATLDSVKCSRLIHEHQSDCLSSFAGVIYLYVYLKSGSFGGATWSVGVMTAGDNVHADI